MMSDEILTDQPNRDARLYGMLCHLLGLSWMVGIPFGWIFGPLVVWMIKRDDHPFIDEQGKEAMNFQLSMTLYTFGLFVTCVGILLIPVVWIIELVYTIIASVKASDGIPYRYPFTIRFF